MADRVAKKGGECEQPDNEIHYFEKKKAIQCNPVYIGSSIIVILLTPAAT